MTSASCECGHEKRDHRLALTGGTHTAGACKVCLCELYAKVKAAGVASDSKSDQEEWTAATHRE
jgi:hypothetical protein